MGVDRTMGITDPRQALEHYRAMDPDLVLLDLHMPHIGGLDLMEALQREIPPDFFVPILVLTADATDTAKQDALGAGATDFLTKPFDQTEVGTRVLKLLRPPVLGLRLRNTNENLDPELLRRTNPAHCLGRKMAKGLCAVKILWKSASRFRLTGGELDHPAFGMSCRSAYRGSLRCSRRVLSGRPR